jgi:hypothetical protein
MLLRVGATPMFARRRRDLDVTGLALGTAPPATTQPFKRHDPALHVEHVLAPAVAAGDRHADETGRRRIHAAGENATLDARARVTRVTKATKRRPSDHARLQTPVEAMQTWLAAAEISAGPVIRAVALGGRVSDVALADDSAARIVKPYTRRAGLDAASHASHGLRSGFLTSTAESGAVIWKLSEVSRHESLDTLRGYMRRVDLFKEHAGAALL